MRVMLTEQSAIAVTVVLDNGNRVVIQPDGDITVIDGRGFGYDFMLPSVADIASECERQGDTGVITNAVVIYHKH